MGITTTDEAKQAFSAVLSGTLGSSELVEALWQADRSIVVEAAARLLAAEATAVLGVKGWTVDECRRAMTKTGRFGGASRVTIEAAMSDPEKVVALLQDHRQDRIGFVTDVFRMLRFLRELPRLAPLHPPGAATDEEARLHAKVRALLAKAESTTFEAEAQACTAKAQELMERHAIDEATLTADRPTPGGATSMRVVLEAPYAKPKAVLLSAVARNNRCRAVRDGDYGFSTVFGVPGDLWAFDLLYTSLLVQAGVALQQEDDRSRGFRHAFLLTFADRIDVRMREATRAAASAATAASGTSFLPVLAAREDAAIAARDEAFPHLRPMRISMSNVAGARAGRGAADAASITRDAAVAGRMRSLGR
jgi:hypothetical protein